jgi:Leucine-rich repeat (LRR) protein
MVNAIIKGNALRKAAPVSRGWPNLARACAAILVLVLCSMTPNPVSAEVLAISPGDLRSGQVGFETRDGLTTAIFPELADDNAVRAALPALRDRDVQSVVLRGSTLRDGRVLAELRNLKSLDLAGSQLRDLAPLAALGRLESLNLQFLRIADIRPLAGLTALRRLNLGGTDVSDISPLAGMTELRELNVAVTKVRDIAPLAGLRRMTWLDLGSTWVSDLRPVTTLTSLRFLNLNGTMADDARPVAGLSGLQTLDLGGTRIADVRSLAGLHALRSLNIEGTLVADVSPLLTLNALETVAAGGSRVSDMTALTHVLSARKEAANRADFDPVLVWNQQALDAIKATKTDPFEGSRALALESIAVLDTFKSIDGMPGFLVRLPAPKDIPARIAASAAAHDVLVHLFPSRKADLDATLETAIATEPAGPARDRALAFGTAMAETVTMIRGEDGSMAPAVSRNGARPGEWRPTPPLALSASHPQWATMVPFAMKEPYQFRPPGPPPLDSSDYKDAVAYSASVGEMRSKIRTEDQTEAAYYWNDGVGTFGPPGHWNAIAASVVQPLQLGPSVEAELFAELNVALSDAAIAVADAKYRYQMWRPITAIRTGSSDVKAVPDWTPLLETPNHPSYVSGHSGFSGAASAVLTSWFGNRAFSMPSASAPAVVRKFANFQQAAEEAADSRVFGGLHFRNEAIAGLQIGHAIGNWTIKIFKHLDEDRGPLVMMMDPAMAVAMGADPSHGLMGCAVDNAAPITSVSVRLDDGSPFSLPVDPNGMFTLTRDRLANRRHAEVTAISAAGHSTSVRIAIN